MNDQIFVGIVRKMERALRNRTGCQLSNEELVAILKSPAWMMIAERERDELIAAYAVPEGENGTA